MALLTFILKTYPKLDCLDVQLCSEGLILFYVITILLV